MQNDFAKLYLDIKARTKKRLEKRYVIQLKDCAVPFIKKGKDLSLVFENFFPLELGDVLKIIKSC